MSNTEFTILIITAIVSILGLSISIMTLRLEIKNRRNSLREKVYDRQLDLFIRINEITADIEDELLTHRGKSIDIGSLDKTDHLVSTMDTLFSRNELLVPEELHNSINDLIIFFHDYLATLYRSEKIIITKEDYAVMAGKVLDVHMHIAQYMGIEILSQENKSLARERRFNSNT